MKMAMMQSFGTAAKRFLTAAEQRVAAFSSLSLSSPSAAPSVPILCGRGDKRTKKGKRFKGSFGNARPKKEKQIERIKDKVEVPSMVYYVAKTGRAMIIVTDEKIAESILCKYYVQAIMIPL